MEENEEKVEEMVEEVKKVEMPQELVVEILELATSERRDVSLQTDLDPSDDEDDEMTFAILLENEKAENTGDWNETIEQHVEEAIEAVVSMQTEEIPETEKVEEEKEVSPSDPVEALAEITAADESITTPAVEKSTTKTSSEDLKCPLCEKPPFKAAELLKHLTNGHFAKQMGEVYKLEVNQPCHLCVKEGRDKPYKMTRFHP